jgi:carbamoyl-phosphate synthase large subunit
MRDITVLSTACGAFFMPGFFRCLKHNHERNITIIGADLSDDATQQLLFVDKYYQVPRYTDPTYVDVLLDICKKEKVDVFFPHISMELAYILERIEDFYKLSVKVAISDSETLNTANSKYQLYEFMRAKGLTVPSYFLVDSSMTLRSKIADLGYPQKPVVVKMTENSGSRGVRIVRADLSKSDLFMHDKPSSMNVTLDEMCEIIDECDPVPEMMAMEFLPGVEYTVDLLADHGKTLYIAGRRNTTSSLSIAQTSVVEKKDSAYKLCEDIVRELNLDGNIGFDFMLDENDTPWLTDLNPRVTATIILYAGAGMNFPYLRVKQLLGEELPNIELKYGTKLVRKYWDVLYNDNGMIEV